MKDRIPAHFHFDHDRNSTNYEWWEIHSDFLIGYSSYGKKNVPVEKLVLYHVVSMMEP